MQIITNQFQKELKRHGSDMFPFLVSHERLSNYESGSFMWHWHPEIEITYVKKGQMTYKVNQRSYHLKTGDMLFGNSNVLHTGCMLDMQDCEYTPVTFSPKLIYGFYQSRIRLRYVEPITQDFTLPAIHFDHSEVWHQDFSALVLEIIALDRLKPPFYEMDIVIKLQTLWKLILENHTLPDAHPAHVSTEDARMKDIIIYIEKNYMRKIMLKDIAAHIHLCESECSRLFRRYMNISLFSFIQEYRIERSLEYLADKNISISEIAGKVGFSDSNYYSKVFTKIKGCSPQKYRRENPSGI